MSDPQNDTDLAASPNPVIERRAQLAALIPEAFSEGKLDLAALKRALGESAVVEGGERYALTWAGKSDAYKVLQTPTTATLRPERDKSVNFDQAQHVFIEGENLEVLKVLQKAYGTDSENSDLVVDFFGGTATTLQAVIEQNAEDGGRRRCIVVQLPQPIDGASDKLKTIADIGRERIAKALANLTTKADLVTAPRDGVGFKSFLLAPSILAPSNFKQWRGDGIDTPEQLAEQIQLFAKSEKEGATVEDMLYELLLKFGQELTTPIEPLEVAGGKVFAIHARKMLFVLESFTEAMILPLMAMKPREIIAIDGVFHDSDMLKTNLDLQCRDAGIRFTCL